MPQATTEAPPEQTIKYERKPRKYSAKQAESKARLQRLIDENKGGARR